MNEAFIVKVHATTIKPNWYDDVMNSNSTNEYALGTKV